MPLLPEKLQEIQNAMTAAQTQIASAEDVLRDLQASGIDSSQQIAQLNAAKTKLAQLQIFYTLQKARI